MINDLNELLNFLKALSTDVNNHYDRSKKVNKLLQEESFFNSCSRMKNALCQEFSYILKQKDAEIARLKQQLAAASNKDTSNNVFTNEIIVEQRNQLEILKNENKQSEQVIADLNDVIKSQKETIAKLKKSSKPVLDLQNALNKEREREKRFSAALFDIKGSLQALEDQIDIVVKRANAESDQQ